MLLALPDESKDRLAADLSCRCRSLTFPLEWMKSMTTLAPKVYGAMALAKFRLIAGLCAMRKLLGYFWILSLPVLTFFTLQTALIPGCRYRRVNAEPGGSALLRMADTAHLNADIFEDGLRPCQSQSSLQCNEIAGSIARIDCLHRSHLVDECSTGAPGTSYIGGNR